MRNIMTPRLLSLCVCSALSVGLAVALCAAAFHAAAQTSASGSVVTVTDAENGKTIELSSGETLRVKLPGNPSTGYDWTLDGDPAPLKLIKSFHQANKKTTGMAGAPQTTVFQLSAPSAGAANVTFIYRRSWEYNVAPAKTFNVRVNVR